MKFLIGINVLTSVDSQVYGNHAAWFFHLGKLSVEKGWEFILFTPWRCSIDRMRNQAASIALLNECDYLMFVDDDMILQLDTLEHLVEADKDIVMAHTYIRGYPYNPMAFKGVGNFGDENYELKYYTDIEEHADEKGLVSVDAVGFATVLIKCSLLKRLSKPYFVTTANSTEDVYFCLKAKAEVPNVSIAVSLKCPTGHLLDKEFVHRDTVKALRNFYEELNGKEENKPIDRGDSYKDSVEALLNEGS